MWGLISVLVVLYIPIVPNIEIGSFDISVTALPIVLLAVVGTVYQRKIPIGSRLKNWQWVIIVFLAFSFFLSTIFSSSISVSLGSIPNLAVYVLAIYAVQALVNTQAKLLLITKVIILLVFIRAIWEIELLPVRLMLGIPGMGGINGTVFVFHAAVAIGLVFIFIRPIWFSKQWSLFVFIVLCITLLRGIEFQTRAAWIAWVVVLLFIFIRIPLPKVLNWGVVLLPIVVLTLWAFQDVIASNLSQTQGTLLAIRESDVSTMNKDDFIREVGREAGLAMVRARPILGWGPGMFQKLKTGFNPYGNLYSDFGTFNAWLTILAENGTVGLLAALLPILTPSVICLRKVGKKPGATYWLAFAYALSVLAFSIHLLFISLMYSFFWVHVGLSLSAVRILLDEKGGKL